MGSFVVELAGKNSETLFELDEAISFFESDAFDTFEDIGDIWGSEESLSWEMELDAEFFSELGEDSGLPVARPEPEKERLSIPELALAVREKTALMSEVSSDEELEDEVEDISDIDEFSEPEEESNLDEEIEIINASSPSFAPSEKESPSVWDFDAFEKRSKPLVPPRRVKKLDSDFGLLDLLGEKSGRSEPDAPKAPQGSSAPKFANVTVPPRKVRTEKKSKKRQSAKKSIPEGSLTGLLFGDEDLPNNSSLDAKAPQGQAEDLKFSSVSTPHEEIETPQDVEPKGEIEVSDPQSALSGFFGEGGHFGGDLSETDDVKESVEEAKMSDAFVKGEQTSPEHKETEAEKSSPVLELEPERKARAISQGDTMLRHFKSNDW